MNKQLVVGYCRVSTKKQEKMGLSLDAQEDYIQQWIKNNGHDLVKVFKFSESGSGEERKHLYDVFKYCLENGIKLILISEVDRWTRNRNMDMEARKYLKKNDLNVYIIDARQSIPEFENEDDELSHNIKVDVADHTAAKIRKKVLFGLEKKLERNEYPGLPPIGYRSIAKTRAGKPPQIVQTDDAPILKKFLETFSGGRFSVQKAIRLARNLGLKPKTKDMFSKGQLGKLIKSQFYHGEFVWSHPWIDDGKQKTYENKTEGFEPIISKTTWKKNQTILKDRQKNFRKEKLSFKFNNLMVCGKCGRKIYGVQFDHKIRNKKYKYAPNYLCTKGLWYTTDGYIPVLEAHVDKDTLSIRESVYTLDERGKKQLWLKAGTKVEEKRCATPSFKEKELEQMLMDEIGDIKFKASHWKRIRALIFQDDTKSRIDQEVQILRMEQTNSEKALNKSYDDFCDKIIDGEFFKSKSEEIRVRQREIKERLSELDEEREHFDAHIGRSIAVIDAMKNWGKILKSVDDEKKNQLIRLLTIKISTIHNRVEKRGKVYERKGLEFTYSPEVRELFLIGLLEADDRHHAANPGGNWGLDNPLIVEKKGMSAAPLGI
jgi:DNA invertase Pin-like site-specific DNA recombinase